MRQDQIALQLYTVREVAKGDFLGTLRKVAEIGYPAVEFAGLHGHSATDVRAVLDEVGMTAPAAHVAYARLTDDNDPVFEELTTLGCEYAIIPWIGEDFRTGDAARRFVATLNPLGEKAKAAGLRLGYHNHDFELAPLDGVAGQGGGTMWDLIVAETDPALVALELDLYWVEYGGGSTTELIAQAPERYELLHFKDMSGEGDARKDAPIGTGSLNLGPIAAGGSPGTKWYVVEQDVPADPLADVATSLAGMRRMVG